MFTTVAQCQNSIEDKIKQALKDENILNDQKHGGVIYLLDLIRRYGKITPYHISVLAI